MGHPGLSPDQYDAVRNEAGWLDSPPTGGLSHVTWWQASDCHNLDTWENEAIFAASGQDRLGPAIANVGLDVEVIPEFHPVHEVFLPKALTMT